MSSHPRLSSSPAAACSFLLSRPAPAATHVAPAPPSLANLCLSNTSGSAHSLNSFDDESMRELQGVFHGAHSSAFSGLHPTATRTSILNTANPTSTAQTAASPSSNTGSFQEQVQFVDRLRRQMRASHPFVAGTPTMTLKSPQFSPSERSFISVSAASAASGRNASVGSISSSPALPSSLVAALMHTRNTTGAVLTSATALSYSRTTLPASSPAAGSQVPLTRETLAQSPSAMSVDDDWSGDRSGSVEAGEIFELE